MKKILIKSLIPFIFMTMISFVYAEALPADGMQSEEQGAREYLIEFLILEGVCILWSTPAAFDPELTGTLSLLFSPIMVATGDSALVSYTALFGIAGISLYNIFLVNEDEISEIEIFRDNMIGWHAVFGLMLLAEWIEGKTVRSPEEEKNLQMWKWAFMPTADGLSVGFNVAF